MLLNTDTLSFRKREREKDDETTPIKPRNYNHGNRGTTNEKGGKELLIRVENTHTHT